MIKMSRFILLLLFFSIPYFAHTVIIEYKWPPTAPEYHIIIATNLSFYFPVVDDTVSATNYIIDLEPGRYYLKIAPVLKGIEGLFSEPVAFSVAQSDLNGRGRLTNVYPPQSTEEELESQTNLLKWNCVIKTNSLINLNSSLYYAVDTPKEFKKANGLQVKVDTTQMEEGYHTLYYKLVNPLGLEGKISSVKFLVEHTPPELQILPDQYKEYGDKTYLYPGSHILFVCQDKWGFSRSYFGVNSRPVKGNSYTVSRETNTLKTISFALNSINSENRLVKTFSVDIDPPQIILFLNKKEVTGAMGSMGDSIITMKITDNTRVYQYYTVLDGKMSKNIPLSIKYLKKGPHLLKVGAEDIFENSIEKSFRIEITEDQALTRWLVYPVKE